MITAATSKCKADRVHKIVPNSPLEDCLFDILSAIDDAANKGEYSLADPFECVLGSRRFLLTSELHAKERILKELQARKFTVIREQEDNYKIYWV